MRWKERKMIKDICSPFTSGWLAKFRSRSHPLRQSNGRRGTDCVTDFYFRTRIGRWEEVFSNHEVIEDDAKWVAWHWLHFQWSSRHQSNAPKTKRDDRHTHTHTQEMNSNFTQTRRSSGEWKSHRIDRFHPHALQVGFSDVWHWHSLSISLIPNFLTFWKKREERKRPNES